MYNYLKDNRGKLLVLPLFIYWFALLIGTSLPSDVSVEIFELSDKLKHFLAYLILAFLLGLNLHFQEKWEFASKNYFFITLLITVIYGAADEIHQIWIPNRSAEFYDWLADLLGSLLGIIFAKYFIHFLCKFKTIS